MTKFRWYFDKDAETLWLNEMVKQGYALTAFFAGFYTFDKCTPGEYVYQIDFGDKFYNVSNDYREFMAEAGIEIVQCWGPWIFLRKKADNKEFTLYTDVDSQIEHYTKILSMFRALLGVELIGFVIDIFAGLLASPVFLIFAFMIALFIVVVLQAIISTRRVITELKERKGETTTYNNKFQHMPLIISGLLFNTCALAIRNPAYEGLKIVIHLIAIVLMLIGIYRVSRDLGGKNND